MVYTLELSAAAATIRRILTCLMVDMALGVAFGQLRPMHVGRDHWTSATSAALISFSPTAEEHMGILCGPRPLSSSLVAVNTHLHISSKEE
ncbi:hypothetical protein VTO73DRAFT_114 [Trametes versicolor]